MKNSKSFFFFLLIIAECFLLSCAKDKELSTTSGVTPFELRMTDAVATYDSVNIDIAGVEIKTNGGATVLLNIHSGIYNLLDYANGNDTLIAEGAVPTATVSQVRLILGNNNSVVVDGISYPLSTPSAQESGLKLQVHEKLESGVTYRMLIDFDANRSIVVTGNGEYKLKPVIRVVTEATGGSIHGMVAPPAALPATVLAVNGNDTITTSTNGSGDFLFQGLAPGTYSVTVVPFPPFTNSVILNVIVNVGVLTELGTITVI